MGTEFLAGPVATGQGGWFETQRGEIQTRWREEMFYAEGGEALAQAAQRGARWPIPGNIQGQAGRALSNLIQLKVSLPMAGGCAAGTLKVPSHTNHLMMIMATGDHCQSSHQSRYFYLSI